MRMEFEICSSFSHRRLPVLDPVWAVKRPLARSYADIVLLFGRAVRHRQLHATEGISSPTV